jgi:hypothetical protein
MLTAEEVRKQLELQPFEGYARKQLNTRIFESVEDASKEISVRPRQIGRTTRMLCSVLAAISSGRPVAIYAKPQAVEAALKDLAQQWAERLGLNPRLILGHLASTAEIEFFDHSWYEG